MTKKVFIYEENEADVIKWRSFKMLDLTFERDVSVKDFSGLYEEHPLYRRGKNTIASAVTHRGNNSLVRYKVVVGEKIETFSCLEEAIIFYNTNRKRVTYRK